MFFFVRIKHIINNDNNKYMFSFALCFYCILFDKVTEKKKDNSQTNDSSYSPLIAKIDTLNFTFALFIQEYFSMYQIIASDFQHVAVFLSFPSLIFITNIIIIISIIYVPSPFLLHYFERNILHLCWYHAKWNSLTWK